MDNLNILIWTTTPWTLPANLAVALNRDLEYSIIKVEDKHIIVGSDLINDLKEKGIDGQLVKTFKGSELENTKYEHPFVDREGIVVLSDHVTATSGSGAVHIAPGHGVDDYIVGLKYGLEIFSPVDDSGCLTKETPFESVFYKDANSKVIDILGDNLLLHEKIVHSYPYSERGKVPIIFRATKQWFVDVKSNLGKEALNTLDDVEFLPSKSVNRLKSMLFNRPDWCISRQRIWGLTIPVFYCQKCDKALLDSDLILEIAEETKNNSQIFLEKDSEYFLKGRYSCCGNSKFIKGKDIFDVWFDSGTTYTILKDKADLYLEGSDQHRGWFQTSLLTSVGSRGIAPYKRVLTHGYVVDGNGIKMSKSIGNVILPSDVIKKYGADILRLWAASVDYSEDVKISDDILKQHVDNYRKIRNFFRFILGNINDFKDSNIELKIDKLAMNRTKQAISNIGDLFDKYQFHNAINEVINFINEMSSVYFDVIKNRLYSYSANSLERRSAQAFLKELGILLTKVLTPVLSFTCEEVWKYFGSDSVLLEQMDNLSFDKHMLDEWNQILKVRDVVNLSIEKAINNNLIKKSEEAELNLGYKLNFSIDELKEIFKVANVVIEDNTSIKLFNGVKCDRCWLYYKQIEGVCSQCKKVLEEL